MLLTCSCTFHFNANGIAVTKATVEQAINEKLPTLYHQLAPDLPLGRAKCPDGLMELDHGKVGRCTFELGMMSVPIMVTLDSEKRIRYKTDGFFLDMKRVQSSIQSELVQNVGVHAEVDCAGPRYRVLKGGAHFSCLIAGIPHLTTIATKVGSNGEISASIPRGFPSREAALSGPLIAEHKAGRRVFASGELLEEIIETQLPLFKAFAAKQNLKLGVLSCPAS